MSEDLYFYQGKFRTELGLKRALIKDDIVSVSKLCNYYLLKEDKDLPWHYWMEYFWDFDSFKDYCTDNEIVTEEEAKHFRKWLNKMIKEGRVEVTHTRYYSADATDNIGTPDFWDVREAVMDCMDDVRYLDDYIEDSERTWENYVDTISDEEFKVFEKLPEEEQNKIAMAWRIKTYKDYMKAQEAK